MLLTTLKQLAFRYWQRWAILTCKTVLLLLVLLVHYYRVICCNFRIGFNLLYGVERLSHHLMHLVNVLRVLRVFEGLAHARFYLVHLRLKLVQLTLDQIERD